MHILSLEDLAFQTYMNWYDMTPNKRGIAKVTAEGIMWMSAPRLSHINGGRWIAEGEMNTIRDYYGSG